MITMPNSESNAAQLCALRHSNLEKDMRQLESFIKLLSQTVQTTHDSVLLLKQSHEAMTETQRLQAADLKDFRESKSKIQGGWFALTTGASILIGFAGLAATIYKVFK